MSSTDTESGDPVEATGEEKPKLSLEVKIDKPTACQRHVTVVVSREDIDRYVKDAFDELKPKAEVPGFRPGRAPRKLIEVRFKDQVADQVKNSLLMDSLSQISEEHEFTAISEPDFDFEAIEIPEDGPFTFEFDIEVRPEFDMPEWKGLKLERAEKTYTDEEVEEELQKLLARYGKVVDRDGAAEMGDILEANIVVRHGEKPIAERDGVAIRVKPKLSFRDASLDEFGELVVGAKKGETREATATISDSAANEALRGQEVKVSLKVTSVKSVELPQLNQAFLESIGGFEDEADLRGAVREELDRQVEYYRQQQLRQQITAALTANADWELPAELVQRQARRELERSVLELRSAGFSDEKIQSHANAIRQNSLRTTETALKEHFILERIAEDFEIDAEPADYDREVDLLAEQSNESPRRVRARLEKRGQMDSLRNQIIERKVIEMICDEADFTDVPLQDKPDDVFAIDFTLSGGHDSTEIPEAKHGGEAEDLRKPTDHS
jgi:trigger factor